MRILSFLSILCASIILHAEQLVAQHEQHQSTHQSTQQSTQKSNQQSASQARTLHGIVREIVSEGGTKITRPLVGATVQWLGTTKGAVTKADGTFLIYHTAETRRLIVSFIGYKRDTITIAPDQEHIDIVLKNELTLSAVEVEGSNTVTITNVTAKTEKLTAQTLEKSACCSLSEAFEKSASVEVSYSDGASGARQITLLGLRSIYSQMLIENVPTHRGLGSVYATDMVPGPFLESISISKGAASVTTGHEGMTGLINLEYKQSDAVEPLFVNLYANHLGRYEANALATQQWSDEFSSAIMLHGRTFKTRRDQNGDGFLDMPLFDQFNTTARVRFSTEHIELQGFVRAIRDTRESGQFNTETHQYSVPHFAINTRTERYEFYTKMGLLNPFDGAFKSIALNVSGSQHRLNLRAGADRFTEDNIVPFYFILGHGDDDYVQNRVYAGYQGSLSARLIAVKEFDDESKLTFGLSNTFDNITDQLALQQWGIHSRDSALYGGSRQENVFGAFAEYAFSPMENMNVVGGIRADYHSLFGTTLTPRLHARYNFSETTTLRASAGSGWRSAVVIGENVSAWMNNRRIQMDSAIRPERSWNYGISFTTAVSLWGLPLSIDAEFYRTEFSNQVVADMDRSARVLALGNLQGESFSNSAMLQLGTTFFDRLEFNFAYRYIDARTATGIGTTGTGMQALRDRMLISPHRILSTASYATEDKGWQFDATVSYNSSGRIPSTEDNPTAHQIADRFEGYTLISGQITKRFGSFDLYVGVENALNTVAVNHIISGHNPWMFHYEAGLAAGPFDNRTFYTGIRWRW